MPRPRRPHEELRPAIIEIADKIIASEGHAALNARRIAAAADCSVGTLYNVFQHLDGIVRSVNVVSMGLLEASLTRALDQAPPDVEARLIAMADAYFTFALDNPHRWEALFHYRSETPTEAIIGSAKDRLFARLQQAASGFGDDDALMALWAAVHGVVDLAMSRRLTGLEQGKERDYARLIIMAGLRGIGVLRKEGLI